VSDRQSLEGAEILPSAIVLVYPVISHRSYIVPGRPVLQGWFFEIDGVASKRSFQDSLFDEFRVNINLEGGW